MTPLDELFMAETMTAQVVEFADQSEENSFISVYEAGERILPTSNKFTYDETSYSRGMAPIGGTQSPSKARTPIGVKTRAAQIYAIKAHVDLPLELLMMARGAGQTMPDPEGWLAMNLKNLMGEVQRTRNYWAALSLHQASVDLGAFPNADVPAGTVIPYPVATLSAVNSWALAATKIRSAEINVLQRTYKQNVGFKAARAIASDTVEGYLTGNTEIGNAVAGVPTLAARKVESSYLDGGSLIRVGGLDFDFKRDDYVTDANQASADAADGAATVSNVITDADLFPVLPPPQRSQECFAMAEGRVFVPTGLITSAAVGNPLSLFSEQRGWAAYLKLLTDPFGLRLEVAWHGTLIQKRRRAVLVFNATP